MIHSPSPITLDVLLKSCLQGDIIKDLPVIRHSRSFRRIAETLEIPEEALQKAITALGVKPGNGYQFDGCLVHRNYHLWTQVSSRGLTYLNCQPVT